MNMMLHGIGIHRMPLFSIEVQRHKATLFMKLNPKQMKPFPEGARDMTNIGHYGTGDLEYTVKMDGDLKQAERLIRMAFEHVGG